MEGIAPSPRAAAVAMLKRAASTREQASPSPLRQLSPSLSRAASSATSRSRPRSRTISSANPSSTDEDTSLFLSPPPGSDGDSASALERTASLLARQTALAKLTGTAPPTPPPTFFTPDESLPTLAELQERARAKFARERGGGGLAVAPLLVRNNTVATTSGNAVMAASVLTGLRRNNTVSGAGAGVDGPVQEQEGQQKTESGAPPSTGRTQARTNLMRKLSARRLEGDKLGVVGRIGRARPRSQSISALDWSSPPPPPSHYHHDVPPLPISTSSSTQPGPSTSSAPLPAGSGVGMGIVFPPSFTGERSETPYSLRSSGSAGDGNWAAERDRQSVLAKAKGEGSWEFEEALRADRGQEDVVGLGQSQLAKQGVEAGEETTPRAEPSNEEAFSTPSPEDWHLSPAYHSADVSPRTSPNPLAGGEGWHSSAPFLAPPIPASTSTPTSNRSSPHINTYRSGNASGSSSSSSSAAPSPEAIPDTFRRAPFLPSFGIAAVEEEEAYRKRGSSASSSLAGHILDTRRFRGSDAVRLPSSGTVLGGLGRNSIVSTTSTAPDEGEDELEESKEEEEMEKLKEEQEGVAAEVELGHRERRLADKVEKKRELAKERAKSPDADKGAFPPPQEGYQFPSPRESQDGWNGLRREDPQELFQQLTSAPTAAPTIVTSSSSPARKSRDFPFKLHYQPFAPNANLPSSPRLPDPISPTHIIPDPMASLYIPHSTPRTSASPSAAPKARFSPTVSRTNGGAANGMERSQSQQSESVGMVKSSSTESNASFRSAAASSYHSPVAMRRDLSSSSRSDDFVFSPRVSQLPAEHLPSNRILAKLDSIIGLEAIESQESSLLDAPPRRLLLQGPVLQVVNANTVKDRHLFLFDDLLIIAKPIIEEDPTTGEPIPSTLDSRFLVKSIVEFKHLKLAAAEDPAEEAASSAASSKKRHPLLVTFVDRFANDPARAIASLVQKGGLSNDGPTIANLLFRNTDLNRNQLGAYLANPHHRHILRAYIERFRFQGVRIDDALRVFCMTVRLPHDIKQAEHVLGVLAAIWTESNGATGFDPSLTFSLVWAILKLSDALHGGGDAAGGGATFFPQNSAPTSSPSVDDFIGAFREHDTRLVVPEDLLARIYTSARRERIEQASDNSIFSMTPDIEAIIEPAKLPTRLTYRSPSDVFTITIPEPDPKFTIKLHGNDLQFHPPVLSFARSNTQSFRVTGNALGVRVMVLIKRGANAPRYQGLPLNKAFSIERGFMQHTFQVSFTNHLELKRKYMFSTSDSATRAQWLRLLRERIISALDRPVAPTTALAAANGVSVQVLRDVFLPPDEPILQVPSAAPSPRPNLAAPRFGPPVTPAPLRTGATRIGTPTRAGTQLARSNSVSKLYAAQFKHEADFGGTLDRRTGATLGTSTFSALGTGLGGAGGGKNGVAAGRDDAAALEAGAPYIKTGREVVVTTEQNSLLPMLLSFLNSGLEAAPHPVSLQGSAFQLSPLPPPNGQHPAVAFASFINPTSPPIQSASSSYAL